MEPYIGMRFALNTEYLIRLRKFIFLIILNLCYSFSDCHIKKKKNLRENIYFYVPCIVLMINNIHLIISN